MGMVLVSSLASTLTPIISSSSASKPPFETAGTLSDAELRKRTVQTNNTIIDTGRTGGENIPWSQFICSDQEARAAFRRPRPAPAAGGLADGFDSTTPVLRPSHAPAADSVQR